MTDFFHPEGIFGVGSDILWCGRWNGGKFCQFCLHYAPFEIWSREWKWYYLLNWYDDRDKGFWGFYQSHYKAIYKSWRTGLLTGRYQIGKYNNTGLNGAEIKSLLRKGCHKKKKCRCVSIAQRGHWYCPECYVILAAMAQHNRKHIHDLMVADRNELKEEFLINRLSGIC